MHSPNINLLMSCTSLKNLEFRNKNVSYKLPLIGHKETIPVTSIVGDLSKAEQVLAAFEGVTCVIHTAALVSVGTFPDVEGMQRVNVNGAKIASENNLRIFCKFTFDFQGRKTW